MVFIKNKIGPEHIFQYFTRIWDTPARFQYRANNQNRTDILCSGNKCTTTMLYSQWKGTGYLFLYGTLLDPNFVESIIRIELTSSAWKADALTVVLYRHFERMMGLEPTAFCLASRLSTIDIHSHLSGKWDSNPRCAFAFQLGRLAPSITRRLPHYYQNTSFFPLLRNFYFAVSIL